MTNSKIPQAVPTPIPTLAPLEIPLVEIRVGVGVCVGSNPIVDVWKAICRRAADAA